MDQVYRDSAYYDFANLHQERLLREASDRAQRLKNLSSRYGLSLRLLDVGCASGYFLRQAREMGWEAVGLDRSKELANKARVFSESTVICGILESQSLVNKAYPVVTAWEVLEHSADPKEFFAALARHVESGGLLALSTPLANGVPAKLLGVRFPMLTPPEHLSLFTRRSIKTLASQFGFEEVSYRSFSNLGPKSLASGLARSLLLSPIEQLPVLGRSVCRLMGGAFAWVPMMVDQLGWGTEMEIIFRRGAV